MGALSIGTHFRPRFSILRARRANSRSGHPGYASQHLRPAAADPDERRRLRTGCASQARALKRCRRARGYCSLSSARCRPGTATRSRGRASPAETRRGPRDRLPRPPRRSGRWVPSRRAGTSTATVMPAATSAEHRRADRDRGERRAGRRSAATADTRVPGQGIAAVPAARRRAAVTAHTSANAAAASASAAGHQATGKHHASAAAHTAATNDPRRPPRQPIPVRHQQPPAQRPPEPPTGAAPAPRPARTAWDCLRVAFPGQQRRRFRPRGHDHRGPQHRYGGQCSHPAATARTSPHSTIGTACEGCWERGRA